jgi:hypothetical protein
VGDSNCHLVPEGVGPTKKSPDVVSVEEEISPDGSSLYEHVVFTNGEIGMFYYFRTKAACDSWVDKIEKSRRDLAPYGYVLNEFMKDLESKYSSRIEFADPVSKFLVNRFNINCQSKDKRYLPLRHVLLAKLSQMDSPKMWMTIRVESRGDEVRIYDILHEQGRGQITELPTILLNKWGELESLNGQLEGIMSACSGIHGPIWMITPPLQQ